MALNLKISSEAAQAEATSGLSSLFDGGSIRFYSGTQAASADTAIGAQILSAEVVLPTPAMSAVSGILTANTLSAVSILSSTTVSWYRCVGATTTLTICDGSVGTTAGAFNCVVNDTAFVASAELTISSFVHTIVRE